VTALHIAVDADPNNFMTHTFHNLDGILMMANGLADAVEPLSAAEAARARAAAVDLEAARVEQQGDAQLQKNWAEYDQWSMQRITNTESCIFLNILLQSKRAPALQGKHLQDLYGRTPLHYAAKFGNTLAIEMLLKTIPSLLEIADAADWRAVDIATFHGRAEAVDALHRAGAAPAGPDRGARLPVPNLRRHLLPDGGAPLAVDDADDGGWSAAIDQASELARGRCDIDEVSEGALDQLTANDFFIQYWLPHRPVILRGMAKNWSVRQAWQRGSFGAKYGELDFETGAIPYSSSFSQQHKTQSLHEYMLYMAHMTHPDGAKLRNFGNNVQYVFGQSQSGRTKSVKLHDALKSDYAWKPDFLQHMHPIQSTLRPANQQFYLGAVGSGAPVHFHHDAWNFLAFGGRRWWLFPPGVSTYSSMPISTWRARHPKPPGALECMQHAGDVIFVPHLWAHGTYNTRQSIGSAVELESSSTGTAPQWKWIKHLWDGAPPASK
jgi:hypothetical protein